MPALLAKTLHAAKKSLVNWYTTIFMHMKYNLLSNWYL